jgi:23S rRNA pseudouridine1911/1915/1917 synthase
MAESYIVGQDEEGQRLDHFLVTRIPDISRSRLRRWLDDGLITVEGQSSIKAGLPLRAGWTVHVNPPEPVPSILKPEAIAMRIVHEDDDLIVIDKPAGLTVHPGAGRRDGTLVHGLLHLHPNRIWPGPPERPGIVHRLDRETSGLLVVACNDRAYLDLQGQIARREASRRYIALVWGAPNPAQGVIDAPMGRDPRDRKKMAVVAQGGRAARTNYRVLRGYGPLSLLEVRLESGRTHQIRVHLSHAGFPVFGDPTYGGGRAFLPRIAPAARLLWTDRLRRLNRQALHAYHLSISHPRDHRGWVFEAPVPGEIEVLLRELSDET